MDTRDIFAAAALAGMLAHDDELDYDKAAAWAYDYADHMIAERQKSIQRVAEKVGA
jgi:hypothetical protein